MEAQLRLVPARVDEQTASAPRALRRLSGALAVLRNVVVQARHSYRARYACPLDRAVVAVLYSLIRHGQRIVDASHDAEGCSFTVEVPPRMWNWTGVVVLDIHRDQDGSSTVAAETRLSGQLPGWDDGKRILRELYADIPRLAELEEQHRTAARTPRSPRH